MITTAMIMRRAWSAPPARKLTKTRHSVAHLTPPNAIVSTPLLGAANVRRVSNIAGDGPPVTLALAIGAGLPIALWTYKVGSSAVSDAQEDEN